MKIFFMVLILTISSVSYAHGTEPVNADHPPLKQGSVLGMNSFEECVAVTMWTITGRSLNNIVNNSEQTSTSLSTKNGPLGLLGSSNPSVKIPKGWTVVGTGTTNEAILFICH